MNKHQLRQGARATGGAVAIGFLVFLTILPATILAQQSLPQTRIRYWLGQLESDQYAQRQLAFEKLQAISGGHVDVLVETMLTGPPESAVRCTELLRQVALDQSKSDMTRIARIMVLLSENGMPHLRSDATNLTQKWKMARIGENIRRLEKAGFKVNDSRHGGGGVVRLRGGMVVADSVPFLPNTFPVLAEHQTDFGARNARPRLNKQQVLEQTRRILATNPDDNDRLLKQSLTEAQARADSNGREAKKRQVEHELVGSPVFPVDGVMLGAAEFFIAPQYSVTIDREVMDIASYASELKLLPGLNSITIRSRDVDAETIKLLSELTEVHSVELHQCSFRAEQLFALLDRRPGLAIDSVGHEAYLGITLQTTTVGDSATRSQVVNVYDETAAKEAGFEPSDIVLAVDGVRIKSHDRLILAVASRNPGDKVEFLVQRGDDSPFSISATLRSSKGR